MIIESVNFNAEAIREMSREEFVRRHIGDLWQDRDEATRRKMLEEAYRIINPERQSNQGKEK